MSKPSDRYGTNLFCLWCPFTVDGTATNCARPFAKCPRQACPELNKLAKYPWRIREYGLGVLK